MTDSNTSRRYLLERDFEPWLSGAADVERLSTSIHRRLSIGNRTDTQAAGQAIKAHCHGATTGWVGSRGSKMDNRKRSIAEEMEYQIVLRLFDSAFEACGQLTDADRQLLLKEIGKRLSQDIRAALPDEQKTVKVVGVKIEQPH
jgi:hypothetical protein